MMVRKLVVGPVLIVVLALALAPLAAAPQAAAQDNRPQIVASFSILADVAQNVAGDAADVTSLIPPGGNPHAFTPSAQDVATLSDADLVLTVGVNFEENLLPVVEEAAGDHQVIVSECLPIHPVQVTEDEHEGEEHADEEHTEEAHIDETAIDPVCAGHYEAVEAAFGIDEATLTTGSMGPLYALECAGHDHEEDEEHEGEEEEHEHAAGSCDPHVWMDPANVALWTLTLRDAFSALDPDNADTYAANADAYLAQLAEVDDQAAALIDGIPEDRRVIVTNHMAFGYLASRYGLDVIGVVIPSASTSAEPSVQELVGLIDTIETHHVPAIFTETTVSQDLAEQVAQETGVQMVQLYTGTLSAPEDGAGTYLDYILYNVTAIADALQ